MDKIKQYLEGEIEFENLVGKRSERSLDQSTGADLFAVLDTDGWVNRGDIDYVEHGGVQIKWEDSLELYEYVELVVPADGPEGWVLFEGYISLEDIVQLPTNPNQRIFEDSPLEEIEFTDRAIKEMEMRGIPLRDANTRDLEELAKIIEDVAVGISRDTVADSSQSWKFEDFGISGFNEFYSNPEKEREMENAVRQHLREMGLDEV